ncbi:unnamed protein product [Linum trigynum]|uniref:Defensin n=1 Tax=Linum trigynum TaxID=586398 RepID=A0AAV2D1L6_9ROSI
MKSSNIFLLLLLVSFVVVIEDEVAAAAAATVTEAKGICFEKPRFYEGDCLLFSCKAECTKEYGASTGALCYNQLFCFCYFPC